MNNINEINLLSSLHGKHNDPSNDHSIRTTTTSSRDTAPSTGPRSHASTYSKTYTTPSHSPTQSPARYRRRADMEEDLVGIETRGYQTDQYLDGRPCTTLPRRPIQCQPTTHNSSHDADSSRSHVDDWSLDEDSCLSDDRELMMHRGSEVLTPHGSSPTNRSEGLTCIGEMFEDTPHAILEGSDSPSSSVDDRNMCLERLAGDLLSEWFGVDIGSLERPIRVVHCLEQVKGQMAAVVEEEGHVLLEDGTESPDTEEPLDTDFTDIQPRDGENTGQATPHGRSQAGEASGQSGKDKKRLSNGDLKSSTSSESKMVTRSPRKRRRIGLDLACPFRKHNPRRFNVRDKERCALRSYVDMATLKKHLFSDHHKPILPWRLCNRCQQSFEDQNNAISHMQQCRASPGPARLANIPDSEDGFDDDVKRLLVSRKDGEKVEKWDALYTLLFPGSIVPNCNFDPVREDHDVQAALDASKATLLSNITKVAEENTTSAEARKCLVLQIQMLLEERDSQLFRRQGQTIAGSQILINTDFSGGSLTLPPEEDFVYVPPEPSQQQNPIDDLGAVVEVPAHYTPSSGSLNLLGSSQFSQRGPPHVLGSTPMPPVMGHLGSQPRSTQQVYNSFYPPMVPHQEQTANFLVGFDTRLHVPPGSTDTLFMGDGSLNATPTYMPRMNNPGIRNSATWPATNTDFNTGQDMSWNDGTMSYEDAGWRSEFQR